MARGTVRIAEAVQLTVLAQPPLRIVERYYLAFAVLMRAGPGTMTQADLEKRCQAMAQSMVTRKDSYSSEFFDRSLFESFVGLLRRRAVITPDGEGRLLFDGVLDRIADDAQLVLSAQVRHGVLQVVNGESGRGSPRRVRRQSTSSALRAHSLPTRWRSSAAVRPAP